MTLFELPFSPFSLIRALCIYAFFSSVDLKALADTFCHQMVITKLSSLLFSVFSEAGGKKLRSTVQRSTETGLAVEMRNWMTRQASRESTDGSMNSYSSEGKWVRLAVMCISCMLCPRPSFLSHSLSFHQLAHSTAPFSFSLVDWLWRGQFALLPLRNVTYLAFYIKGNRFGNKMFLL